MKNLSRVFQKQKRKKKQHKTRLSFITHFKFEFLLPFTGCRKVLGKMPECVTVTTKYNITDTISVPPGKLTRTKPSDMSFSKSKILMPNS